MVRDVIVFDLDGQRYGLPLQAVEHVIRAVEVTPLPQAPANVLGVINMQGCIVPVFSLRRHLRLPEREIEPEDQFIIAHTGRRRMALVVDAVNGVTGCADQDLTAADRILAGLEFVEGVLRTGDGMILIVDLGLFLSLHEERLLDEAITSLPPP